MVIQRSEIHRVISEPGTWISLITAQARQCRSLWFGFIFTSLYLLVTLFSLTHSDLFLETPLALPVVQLKVPVSGFLWFAPIILVCLHFFLLLSILSLTNRTRTLLEEVDHIGLCQADQDRFRFQLSSFFLLSVLAPTSADKKDGTYHLFVIATVATLILAPLLVLMLFVLQALPLHQNAMIGFLRLAFVLDAVASAYVWANFFAVRNIMRKLGIAVACFLTSAYLVFSLASLPESLEPTLHKLSWKPAKRTLVEGSVNELTGQRNSLFSNTLVLSDKDLRASGDALISMRGRNLDGALFIRATFSKIDFTGASLRNASFEGATADRAVFGCAKDGEAFLNRICTDLEKASFEDARFNLSDFAGSNLKSADLTSARLVKADFSGANLSATLFYFAKAQQADFTSTTGFGTQFENSDISGSDFSNATLIGANFNSAIAAATNFRGSNLTGSIFSLGEFHAAKFDRADLRGSAFSGADISLSFMFETNLSGIYDFSDVTSVRVVADHVIENEMAFENIADLDELLTEFGNIGDLEWALDRPPKYLDPLFERMMKDTDQVNLVRFLDSALPYPAADELDKFESEAWRKRISELIEAYCDPLRPLRLSDFTFALSWHPNYRSNVGFLGPYRRGLSKKLLDLESCTASQGFTNDQRSTLGNYVTAERENFEVELPKE